MVILDKDILNSVADFEAAMNLDLIVAAFNTYNHVIETPLELAHFVAQAAYETGGFRWAAELGNRAYFQRYDMRADLGNREPGDGFFFRGRGLFMLTGRFNYSRMGQELDLDLVHRPDMAMQEDIAVQIALKYWEDKYINDYADEDDIYQVTYRINGGSMGLAGRQLMLNKLKVQMGLAIGNGPLDG